MKIFIKTVTQDKTYTLNASGLPGGVFVLAPVLTRPVRELLTRAAPAKVSSDRVISGQCNL